MPARVIDGPSHTPLIESAAFAFLTMLVGAPIPAHAQSTFYDTRRVLRHDGIECAGVPSCRAIKTDQKTIAVGESKVLTYNCPARAPYLVGWDTEQHEQIQVRAQLNPSKGSGHQGVIATLVVTARNDGNAPGTATIFLGCSDQIKMGPIGIMEHSSGVPTKTPRRP